MTRSLIRAALCVALAAIPIGVSAQVNAGNSGGIASSSSATNAAGVQAILMPSVPVATATLTAACATPATPASCASGSAAIYPTSTSGVGDVSLQIAGTFVGSITMYGSDDGTNFVPMNLSQNSTNGTLTLTQAVTGPGIYRGSAGPVAYLAVVATAFSSGSATVTPFLGSKTSQVELRASAPIGLTPLGIGALFGVPTSGSGTAVVALGTPPASSTSFGFYVPGGASVQYGFGTSAAAALSSGLVTIANPSGATTLFWPDNFSGLTVYVGAVSGGVLARYF